MYTVKYNSYGITKGVRGLKKYGKAIFNALFLIVLIAATLYFILRDQNIGAIFAAIRQARKIWLILAIILVFVFVCSESVIIKYLMRQLSNHVRLVRCIKYSFIGFFFSCVTPSASGGQPMQVYYMQKDKLNVSVSALVLLIVTVGYKAVLVVLSGVMFLFERPFIMTNLGNVKYILIYGIIANVLFIAFLLLMILKGSLAQSMIDGCIHFLSFLHIIKNKKKIQEKFYKMMGSYHAGAAYIRNNWMTLIIVFLISVVQRVALFLVPWCVYRSFGLFGISAVQIVTLQTIIALSVDMLPLPGGVGASETSFTVMFGSIFGSQLLIPGMLLSRGISYYFLVFISGIVTVAAHFLLIRRGRKKE